MSDDARNDLVVLTTGLHPDVETLEKALQPLAVGRNVRWIALAPTQMDEAQWDEVLGAILSAARVVAV